MALQKPKVYKTKPINKSPGRRKGAKDIAPLMRAAAWKGLVELADKRKMTVSGLWAEWWEEDWAAAAAIMAKYMPKESTASVKIDDERKHKSELIEHTQAWLTEIVSDETEEEVKSH